MSRIGKKAIPLPDGVTANIQGQEVVVKGPNGSLKHVVNSECLVEMGDEGIAITRALCQIVDVPCGA
jgi:large subunit ribosomal protein L6